MSPAKLDTAIEALNGIIVTPPRDTPAYRYMAHTKVSTALAQGQPIVASALPSIQEIIVEGQNGFLFPPGDVSALAETIERVAGLTDIECERLREEMKQTFASLSFPNRARQVIQRFDEVCGGRRVV